uniref:Uncharacterized protein n=1 Tax=Heterorhabditis bacteriophora TaxID=37862 RepID=A0A1I7XCJ2_HETBA
MRGNLVTCQVKGCTMLSELSSRTVQLFRLTVVAGPGHPLDEFDNKEFAQTEVASGTWTEPNLRLLSHLTRPTPQGHPNISRLKLRNDRRRALTVSQAGDLLPATTSFFMLLHF